MDLFRVADKEAREQILELINIVNTFSGRLIKVENEVDLIMSGTVITTNKPLVLYADNAEDYKTNATIGDETLEAILSGRPILIRVPNADGGTYTAIYSPVLMYQLPNQDNNYLYLFFLRDEKQDLSSVVGMDLKLPTYGELKLLLSETYTETPLT